MLVAEEVGAVEDGGDERGGGGVLWGGWGGGGGSGDGDGVYDDGSLVGVRGCEEEGEEGEQWI